MLREDRIYNFECSRKDCGKKLTRLDSQGFNVLVVNEVSQGNWALMLNFGALNQKALHVCSPECGMEVLLEKNIGPRGWPELSVWSK